VTLTDAIRSWDALLAEVDAAAMAILTRAEADCARLLDLKNLDPLPMSNAWTAVNTQLLGLTTKVEQTWREKIQPVLEEAEQYDDRDRERQKGDALIRRLETNRERLEVGLFGVAAQRLYAQLRADLVRDVRCTQCFAALPVGDRLFRARQVACPQCQAVNAFAPDAKVTALEYFCCHHLARLETRALYEAWLAAEGKMRRSADDLAAMKAAERALEAYARAYLAAKIAIVPEYEATFDTDLKGKMAFFYEELGRSTAWRP